MASFGGQSHCVAIIWRVFFFFLNWPFFSSFPDFCANFMFFLLLLLLLFRWVVVVVVVVFHVSMLPVFIFIYFYIYFIFLIFFNWWFWMPTAGIIDTLAAADRLLAGHVIGPYRLFSLSTNNKRLFFVSIFLIYLFLNIFYLLIILFYFSAIFCKCWNRIWGNLATPHPVNKAAPKWQFSKLHFKILNWIADLSTI